jgi:hypothetical protein
MKSLNLLVGLGGLWTGIVLALMIVLIIKAFQAPNKNDPKYAAYQRDINKIVIPIYVFLGIGLLGQLIYSIGVYKGKWKY